MYREASTLDGIKSRKKN